MPANQVGNPNNPLLPSSAYVGVSPPALWVILALGFLARLAWISVVESGITSDFVYDATLYFEAGRQIAAGEGFVTSPGVPTAYFPPGYPVILAGFFVLFGPKFLLPALINSVAGTATCWVTYKLGARAYGLRAGLIGAALLAFWPSHIYASSATMSETVFTFLLTSVIYCFYLLETSERGERNRGWLLLGFLVGFTSLVRGAGFLFVGVLALALLINHGFKRKAFVRLAMLLVPLLLTTGLWTLRNQITMGAPILLGTSGGWSFFNAHNEKADGGQSWVIDRYRMDLFKENLTSQDSRENDVTLHALQVGHAVNYMATHPMEELAQIPKRVYRMHRSDDWPLMWIGWRTRSEDGRRQSIEYVNAHIDPWLPQIANVYYFVALGLGLSGLVLGFSRVYRRSWIIPLSVIYFHVLHGVIFFGTERFHAPFLPELALGAGLLLTVAGREVRKAAR